MINLSKKMFGVIQTDLRELEKKLLAAIDSDVPLVAEIGNHLINSGGKRLRPALCLLAARGGQDFKPAKILPLAAAMEMIHTATLVHDDVIDAADMRRNSPTANAKWGNQVAILSGDYLFARAFQVISGENYGNYVSQRLAELVGNLAVGEIMQDQHLYEAKLDWTGYYDRIKKKTADFLEICCELGGVVGGMAPDDCAQLAAYGHAVGMAFQITDDMLDVWQNSEILGKPVGNDIKQGIVTLPILRALETSPCRDELTKILSDSDMTSDMVQRAIDIIRSTDAREFADVKVGEYLNAAKETLPSSLPPEIRNSFIAVADFVAERKF